MSGNQELLKKLIDDDELESVELQKGDSPLVVTGVAVPPKKKKVKGCPCWCKCLGITMIIFTLLGIVGLVCAYSFFKDVVDHLTIETDSPEKFPIVKMSDAELQQVIDRVDSFMEDIMDEEEDIKDLVLTQDEINGFIGHSDYLRGNMMVTFQKDRIIEEYSLPMNILGFHDRYFVGNDYLALKSEGEKDIIEMKMETQATHEDWFDGPLFFAQLQYLFTKDNSDDDEYSDLELYLEKGSFFGQMVPQEFIDERQNLVEGLYDADDDYSMDMVAILDGIEDVSIQEGKVVVKARQWNDQENN